MPDNTPFCSLSSTVTLTSAQHEEFVRVSETYHKIYQYLLLQWYGFSEKKPLPQITSADFKFINERLRSLIHIRGGWIEEDCLPICLFAANELCRTLSESDAKGKPTPHPKTNPIEKKTDEVVFYRDYDIRVKQKTVRLPVIGKANVGKFSFFSGSIRGVGIRTDANGDMQCIIYYKENSSFFRAKDPSIWQIGSDSVLLSPLNRSLREKGIGFML